MVGHRCEMYADFVGSWGGSAPLTWGQRHIWNQIQRIAPNDHFLNASYPFPLPEPSSDEWPAGRKPTPDTVVRALAEVVSRYEALRTRVRVVDDEPEQVVARTGRVGIEIIPTTADRAHEAAEAARTRLYGIAFDYATDLPLRASVVTVDGFVTHVVLCLSHLSVDGWSVRIIIGHLRRLIVHGVAQVPASIEPVDLTRRQSAATAGGRRVLAYWASAWRRIPPAMFVPRHPLDDPPFLRLKLESDALTRASRLVAAQRRVSTSTVLLAAVAARIAAVTGHDQCAMLLHSGNRHQNAFATLIGPMSQLGLFTLDLSDRPPFDELVRRSFRASLTAYRNAYYDQAALDAELARVCQERGTAVVPHCCYNDRRRPKDRESAAVPTEADVLAALADTRVLPTTEQPAQVDCRFCIELRTPLDRDMTLVLTADTSCLRPDEMTRFLLDLERDVVTAACGQRAVDSWPVAATSA